MVGPKDFAKFGATRMDLEAAWNDRLLDADALHAAGRCSMSIAMALYALEILLKERICHRLDLERLPRAFEFHDLDGLIVLAGYFRGLNDPENLAVRVNWDQAKEETGLLGDRRYRPASLIGHGQVKAFFASSRGEPHGVIPWILSLP